jgi:uncharacterized membrane protein (DUF373 family)
MVFGIMEQVVICAMPNLITMSFFCDQKILDLNQLVNHILFIFVAIDNFNSA